MPTFSSKNSNSRLRQMRTHREHVDEKFLINNTRMLLQSFFLSESRLIYTVKLGINKKLMLHLSNNKKCLPFTHHFKFNFKDVQHIMIMIKIKILRG